MNTTPVADIAGIVTTARESFQAGRTRPHAWRRDVLARLRSLTQSHESALLDALAADFGKPRLEAWAAEIGFVLSDIDHVLANLDAWTRPEKVPTPVAFQPGSSEIVREPLGVACVIAPWNYPFQLLVLPMVAAISAGNAVVGKPSELAPHTSEVTARIFADLADPAVEIIQGGVAETTELLAQRFDHIALSSPGKAHSLRHRCGWRRDGRRHPVHRSNCADRRHPRRPDHGGGDLWPDSAGHRRGLAHIMESLASKPSAIGVPSTPAQRVSVRQFCTRRTRRTKRRSSAEFCCSPTRATWSRDSGRKFAHVDSVERLGAASAAVTRSPLHRAPGPSRPPAGVETSGGASGR